VTVPTGFTEDLLQAAEPGAGDAPPVVDGPVLERLAKAAGLDLRAATVAALEAGVVPRRYVRNMGTVGLEGQLRLARASVGVVGAGGLGGLVIELLARMGVGRLVVADADAFEENNLNRQLLCTEATLGRPKVAVAAERVRALNRAVAVEVHLVRADEERLVRLLEGCSVAVDALDNLPSRYDLEAACRRLGIPFVHGAIAGFMGQVTTVFPGDRGLASLYGPRERAPERGSEVATGNPAATPAIVAAWQAQEVVKLVTGRGEPLRRRLLVMDSEVGQVDVFSLG